MRPRAALRALTLLGVDLLVLTAVVPRRLPRVDALQDPAVQAQELSRFGAGALAAVLAGYLAVVLGALVLHAVPGSPVGLRRWIDRRTSSGTAALVRRLVGATALTFGALPGVASAAPGGTPVLAPAEADAPPVLAPVAPADPRSPTPADSVPAAGRSGSPGDEPGPPLLAPMAPPAVDAAASPDGGRTPRPAPVSRPPGPDRRPDPPTPPTPLTVTVAAGDSFWSLASDLAARDARADPGPDAVAEVWLALIEANRDRLVDPQDPDLLLPGQVLRLPPGLS